MERLSWDYTLQNRCEISAHEIGQSEEQGLFSSFCELKLCSCHYEQCNPMQIPLKNAADGMHVLLPLQLLDTKLGTVANGPTEAGHPLEGREGVERGWVGRIRWLQGWGGRQDWWQQHTQNPDPLSMLDPPSYFNMNLHQQLSWRGPELTHSSFCGLSSNCQNSLWDAEEATLGLLHHHRGS